MLDANGKPVKVFKVAVDVTAQEHEKRSLQATEKKRAAELAQQQEEQTNVVSALAEGLRELARGNLQSTITTSFSGDY